MKIPAFLTFLVKQPKYPIHLIGLVGQSEFLGFGAVPLDQILPPNCVVVPVSNTHGLETIFAPASRVAIVVIAEGSKVVRINTSVKGVEYISVKIGGG